MNFLPYGKGLLGSKVQRLGIRREAKVRFQRSDFRAPSARETELGWFIETNRFSWSYVADIRDYLQNNGQLRDIFMRKRDAWATATESPRSEDLSGARFSGRFLNVGRLIGEIHRWKGIRTTPRKNHYDVSYWESTVISSLQFDRWHDLP